MPGCSEIVCTLFLAESRELHPVGFDRSTIDDGLIRGARNDQRERHFRAHLPDVEQREFLTARAQQSGDAVSLAHEAQCCRTRSIPARSGLLRIPASLDVRSRRRGWRRWCCAWRGSWCCWRRRAGDYGRTWRRCRLCGWSRARRWLTEEPGDIVPLSGSPWRTRRCWWRCFRCAGHRCCWCGGSGRRRWTRCCGRGRFRHLRLLRGLCPPGGQRVRAVSQILARDAKLSSLDRARISQRHARIVRRGHAEGNNPGTLADIGERHLASVDAHRPGQRVAVPRDDDRSLTPRRTARGNLFDRPRTDEGRGCGSRLAFQRRGRPEESGRRKHNSQRPEEHSRLIIASQNHLHPAGSPGTRAGYTPARSLAWKLKIR